MNDQMTLFDLFPDELKPGDFVNEHGAVICHIMRKGYIGKMVVIDCSTVSHKWYKLGILENVLPDFYWNGDRKIPCDRSVIYTGHKQRSLILHMPGREIYEVRPWAETWEERRRKWTT